MRVYQGLFYILLHGLSFGYVVEFIMDLILDLILDLTLKAMVLVVMYLFTIIYSLIVSVLLIYLSFFSHSSASQAHPSCHGTTAGAASSALKAAPRTWAQRMSLQTMSIVQSRKLKTVEGPYLYLTVATAIVATAKARHGSIRWHPTLEGKGTAQWTATAWCLSTLGPADGFCLR